MSPFSNGRNVILALSPLENIQIPPVSPQSNIIVSPFSPIQNHISISPSVVSSVQGAPRVITSSPLVSVSDSSVVGNPGPSVIVVTPASSFAAARPSNANSKQKKRNNANPKLKKKKKDQAIAEKMTADWCYDDDVSKVYAPKVFPFYGSPGACPNECEALLDPNSKELVPYPIFSKLVQSYLTLTPHSCAPEQAVSIHTILKSKKQSCYSRETLNHRMHISCNGVDTAFYDPRPAVAKFLEMKERRWKLPDQETYKEHEFVRKFFSEKGGM